MGNWIIFVMDSVPWKQYKASSTPNFDIVGEAKESIAAGTYTAPSMYAMFRGRLPEPIGGGTLENYFWPDDQELHKDGSVVSLRTVTFRKSGYKSYLITDQYMLHPRLGGDMFFDDMYFTYNRDSASDSMREMIDYSISKMKGKFIQFIFTRATHRPFYHPETDYTPSWQDMINVSRKHFTKEAQVKAIEWCDEQFKRLYDAIPVGTNIVITSDHGEIWVDEKNLGHGFQAAAEKNWDVLAGELLKVPTALGVKK